MSLVTREPQGPLEIIRGGLRLYKTSLSQTWWLALAAGLLGGWWGEYTEGLGESLPVQIERAGGATTLLGILCNLGTAALSLVIIRRTDHLARGLLPDLVDEGQVALGAMPGFLLASLIYLLLCAAGLLVFVAPGLYVLISFGFYGYFMVLEEHGPLQALRASFRLVEYQWWHAAGACALVLLLVLAVALPVFLALGVAFLAMDQVLAAVALPQWIGAWLMGAGGNALLEPLAVSLSLGVYYDLRARKAARAA